MIRNYPESAPEKMEDAVSDMGEQLARKFHETYERLAPSFGYETRTETRAFEPTTPNGRLMIAVCAEIMGESAPCLTKEQAQVLVEDLCAQEYLELLDERESHRPIESAIRALIAIAEQ